MKKNTAWICCGVATLLIAISPAAAYAGATVMIGRNGTMDIGARVQPEFYQTQRDLDGDGIFETVTDFRLRRAQLLVSATLGDTVGMRLETDIAEEHTGQSGAAMRVVEAYTLIKFDEMATLLVGQQLAPGMRPEMTNAGTHLTIDYPLSSYRSLSFGMRAPYGFGYTDYEDGTAGARIRTHNRDMGAALFGTGPVEEGVAVKYLIGMFDGMQEATTNSERIAGRVQFNFGAPEPLLLNAGTYLGQTQTLATGFFYDTQPKIAYDPITGNHIDYVYYGFDVFNEYGVGDGGILTFEGGMNWLELADTVTPVSLNSGAAPANQLQGSGFYAQVGYYVAPFQPWILIERWNSDAADHLGSFKSRQYGINYHLQQYSSTIRIAYEQFTTKAAINGTRERKAESMIVGLTVAF